MKLKDIKTEKQFYDVAEIWYQRTIKLAEIWQNHQESEERKIKALNLWIFMIQKMRKMVQLAIIIETPKPKKKSVGKEGQAIVGEKGGEFIISPSGSKIVLPKVKMQKNNK